MNKINRDNYEAYLLDFSEGNLSEELQMELEIFLIQHPELNINLTDLSLTAIEAEELTFKEKPSLKKTDSQLISENQFISYIENQLSLEERKAVEKSCTNNEGLEKELVLFKSTIAVADATVIFPDKNGLKRQSKVIWLNFSATQYSIAASVLLLLGLYIFWPKTQQIGNAADYLAFEFPAHTSKIVNENIINENVIASNNSSPTTNNKTTSKSGNQQPVINNVSQLVTNTASPHEETNNSPVTNLTTSASISNNMNNETSLVNKDEVIVSKSKTVVEVITEKDDENIVIVSKKKKGFWAFAERTLRNLNSFGVKSVNGEEENSVENNSYALTLGGVNITHKSN